MEIGIGCYYPLLDCCNWINGILLSKLQNMFLIFDGCPKCNKIRPKMMEGLIKRVDRKPKIEALEYESQQILLWNSHVIRTYVQ